MNKKLEDLHAQWIYSMRQQGASNVDLLETILKSALHLVDSGAEPGVTRAQIIAQALSSDSGE